jgi:transcriptional regulator with PAS, ATPase and Fis domain
LSQPPNEIAPFRLRVRDAALAQRAEIEALLGSVAFRRTLDLMPDPIVIVDPDDALAMINAAAERASGIGAAEAERMPLAAFLRRSDLDMDEFIGATGRGQSHGVVTARSNGRAYPAMRRILAPGGNSAGFAIYMLRDAEPWDRARRGIQSRVLGRGAIEEQESLIFPPSLGRQIEQAIRAYRRKARILLLGESGVGKTAVAKHVHMATGGPERPFIHVNCGSIPETLFESELFGYERGAFTGALQAGKRGLIESAGGGTLFLDEIGEIPLSSQAKLLKFLEDGTIQSIGSAASKKVEATVIAATNRDLGEMVRAKTFRKDLYFRISTFPVRIPALRDRPDRAALIDALLARANRDRPPRLELSRPCRERLERYSFPGNLRQLKSVIEYLDIVCDSVAGLEHMPETPYETDVPADAGSAATSASLKQLTRAFERKTIAAAVARLGSKRKAAQALGIDIATLIRKSRAGP